MIRPYRSDDAQATLDVFYRAIRVTASRDYDPAQLAAWASPDIDPADWATARKEATTWVAEIDGTVVGFTDIDPTGYIDMMFVDPRVGRTGVAGALLDRVTEIARSREVGELTVNASLTARPFFERRGFTMIAEQQVERRGSVLTNFRMRSPLR
ncbi:GNAT family N-acetyltransferase [Streptosporangium carneum]|uniref:GNAT family N-acetyltransferase n=1 Tax=Streptosporangium carneum TaxID=47481 RepID=UPI0022F2CCD3|nr:GNAT family N-acetyltransferase [Streptosporangium carneum]